jgi:DNA-binding transcriptional LysR family regulator
MWNEISVVARHIGANNGDVLCDAAVAGLGVVVLPTFIVGDALAAGALKIVLGDCEVASPSILVVWPPSRHVSGKVRAFVDLLAKRFSGIPYWDRSLLIKKAA